MKILLTAVCLLLSTVYTVSAQDVESNIKYLSKQYGEALSKQDVADEVRCYYPKYVEANGGRDSLIKSIQNEYHSSIGYFELLSYRVGEPGQITRYGATYYCILPDTFKMKYLNQYPKQIVTKKSYLVAISDDSGQNWSFVKYSDLTWLKSILPDVAKLNIPKPAVLTVQDLNATTESQKIDTGVRNITINLEADTNKPSKISYDKSTKQYSINFGKQPPDEQNTDGNQGVEKYYMGRKTFALVVITRNKEFLADTNSIKLIRPEWIKSGITDIAGAKPNDTLKYGGNAINGIGRCIIDDKKYPKAYLKITKCMKFIGPFDTKTFETN